MTATVCINKGVYMTKEIINSVISDAEKAVSGFKMDDWKDRKLLDRFNEMFKMVDSYDVHEEQKVYLFRRGVILLVIEAVHDKQSLFLNITCFEI